METKRCPKCEQVKSLTDFAKDKCRHDGLQAYCRPCVRQVWQKWAEDNRERLRLAEQARRQETEYRAHQAEYKAAWQTRNRGRINEQARVTYAVNPASFRARNRRWNQANPGRLRAAISRWGKANPDRLRAYRNRRRARASQGNHYTPKQWQALCAFHGNVCLRCGKSRKLTADHVLPLSKGGGNGIDNIQPLCGPCNSSKGTKTIDYRL